ncbi:hypothetical protein F5887DRAFT_1074512 [Amanita rubescens]|nr:hypothetical protein F5887DRAFT_1074512 [Amanita rubescens]
MASSATEPAQEAEPMELSSEEGNGTETEESDESETKGPNLCEDLESILKEKNLEAPGSFAHSSILPFGPYPCLNIEGHGGIGLPLSEPEAKRVIAYASHAAYDQGVVNKQVRDTWEIDASRVKLDNPNWLTYRGFQTCPTQGQLEPQLKPQLKPQLGLELQLQVGPLNRPHEPDSKRQLQPQLWKNFLPHRDTQKADGMFATMIILLPSQYTGGEVHLSHASKMQVIDFSASSLANTAVLAWYTDVLHEMKPVTSGYRLALSYNLIHTSPRMPLPTAPSYDGPCTELRRVLCKWKEGSYQQPEKHNCIAYLLKHRYSEVNFRHGPSCLKGEDDERVTLVRVAAEGLGFVVLLANIEYCVSRQSYGQDYDCSDPASESPDYDHAASPYQRGRVNANLEFDDDDICAIITLSKVFDLSGHVVLDPKRRIEIGDDCFLPKDALGDEYPDDRWEHKNYDMATDIQYFYRRFVFVLLPSDQLPHILMLNGGVGYMIKLFEESLSENAPKEKDRHMAKLIISNLPTASRDNASAMKTMFNYTYKWKDIEMWQGLMKSCGYFIKVEGEFGLVRAWSVFSFDQTRASIENLLCNKWLPDRLAFVNAIRQAALESDEKDVIQDWCLNQIAVALASYDSPLDDRDIPLLVSMACENGIQSIRPLPIERINPEKAFHFLTALVKALHPKQAVVLEKTAAHCAGNNDPQSEAADMLDEFVRTCLDSAGKQWNVKTSWPNLIHCPSKDDSNQRRRTRVLNLIELCILTRQMNTCRAFLDRVWNLSGEMVDKFNEIYTPLIPELRKLLRKTNIDVSAPPFIDFFRLLISHYLCDVLGTKGQQAQLRQIGCGCADCQVLDDFMVGMQSQYTFLLAQERSHHLKSRMDSARDLVTHETQRHGKLHQLIVSKTQVFLSAIMWKQRVQVAKNMFQAIGLGNIKKIMGDRYVDVFKTLKGLDAFRLDKVMVPLQNALGPVSTSTVNTTTSVIGRKREPEPEVIGLTD